MYNYPYYYSQPSYYYNPPNQSYYPYRQYPQVDESTFIQSVQAFKKMTKEASTILGEFSNREFAHQLMAAAQQGNQQEVDRLMKSIGISSPITTQYTPTGIELKVHAQAQGSGCCTLTMYLKWGD